MSINTRKSNVDATRDHGSKAANKAAAAAAAAAASSAGTGAAGGVDELKGWLYFNCNTGTGKPKLRLRWFVYSEQSKQVEYFLNPKDLSRLGAISIETSAFNPSAVRDNHGFYYLDIVTNDRLHRLYHEDWTVIKQWKNGLQTRRGQIISSRVSKSVNAAEKIKKEMKNDGAKVDEGNSRWGEAKNPTGTDMSPVVEDYQEPRILNSQENLKQIPAMLEQPLTPSNITTPLPNLENIHKAISAEPAHKDCETCERLRSKYADTADRLRMMERQLNTYKEMLECHEHAWRDVMDTDDPPDKNLGFANTLLNIGSMVSPSLSFRKSEVMDGPNNPLKKCNQLNKAKKERAAFIRQNAILQAELVNLRRYWAGAVQHEHFLIVALEKISIIYRQQREVIDKKVTPATHKQMKDAKQEFDEIYQVAVRQTDVYGFFSHYGIPEQITIFKQLEDVSNGFEYLREPDTSTVDALQQQRWDAYMVKHGDLPLSKTNELKNLLRTGIPPQYRGKIWEKLTLFYVQQYRSQHESNYYDKLVEKVNQETTVNPEAKQIDLDLLRSLPENVYFETPDPSGPPDNRSGIKLSSLRNVLLSFANEHTDTIGYCQGMDRLAAILLLNVPEEMAFWSLTVIVRRLRPAEYYTPTLKDAKADQRVFQDLIAEQLPSVSEKLREFDVDISLFSFKWFLTMFVDGFSWKVYMKIWDAFLYEGDKVIFRYGVAMMVYLEPLILYQQDAAGLMKVLRSAGHLVKDHCRLTHIAFHDLRQFPKRRISQKRTTYRDKIEQEMDQMNRHRNSWKNRKKIELKKINSQSFSPDSDD